MEKMWEMPGMSNLVQYREIFFFSQVGSFWWKPELSHGAGSCGKTGQSLNVGARLDIDGWRKDVNREGEEYSPGVWSLEKDAQHLTG